MFELLERAKFFFSALVLMVLLVSAGCLGSASPTPMPSVPSPTPALTPSAASPTARGSITTPPSSTPSQTAQPSSNASSLKELKIKLALDEGTRIEGGSVPYAFKLKDGRVRLYYCSEPGVILSALSQDGLSFQKEPGVRMQATQQDATVCDPTIVALPDGRVRMYYKIAFGRGGMGSAVHKIASAISSDGLSFKDEGIRLESENTADKGWASVPEAVLLSSGLVRIYYVSGSDEAGGGIASAVSSDGLNFEREGARIPYFVDPAVMRLPNGLYLLLAVAFPFNFPANPPGGSGDSGKLERGIYGFVSMDGLNFTQPMSMLVAEDTGVYDPSVMMIDDSTFRVYYGKEVGTPSQPNIVVKSFTGKIS